MASECQSSVLNKERMGSGQWLGLLAFVQFCALPCILSRVNSTRVDTV